MNQRSQYLVVKNRIWRKLRAQPVTIGVPWPKGLLRAASAISLRHADGHLIPMVSNVLNRWPDGSVQWTLLDFASDFDPGEEKRFIVAAGAKRSPAPPCPVKVRRRGNVVAVSNGILALEIASAGKLLRKWTANGKTLVEADAFDIIVTDLDGKEFKASAEPRRKVTVEHANSLRTVVRVDGKHQADDGSALLNYWLKFTLYAGRPEVKLTYHFRNREEVVPSVKVKSIRISMTLGLPPNSERSLTHPTRGRQYWCEAITTPDNFEVFSSDTPEIDKYADKHKNGANGDVFVREGEALHDSEPNLPWFMRNLEFRGTQREKCVWPYLGLRSKNQSAVFLGADMAQLHPKSYRIEGNLLTYNIWPDWAVPLEIRQGAGKTHDLYLAGLPGNVSNLDLQTQYLSWPQLSSSPLSITPDIAWIRAAGVFKMPMVPEYQPHEHLRFERKVAHNWLGVGYGSDPYAGAPGAPANGMWHYGDSGIGGNNEEMVFQTFLMDYLRSGRWLNAERGLQGCQHLVDVDYVDHSVYPYQHHGMCAHCPDHNNGAVYPSHEWFNELFIAYAITGNPEFKQVALNLCENLLYWINTPIEFRIVASDQREAGQPMINLMWAYEWNPDRRYIAACMKIWREALVEKVRRYGRMLDAKPTSEMPVQVVPYGDYATWQGLYWLWETTRKEELAKFYLTQCEWRVAEEKSGTAGWMRCTDYNVAAFAYYVSGGDRKWLDRVARPFHAAFSGATWNIGWMHAIYFIKLAFDYGIVKDDDVALS